MLQRIIIIVSICIGVVSCQSVSTTDVSSAPDVVVVTETPVAQRVEPPAPRTTNDNEVLPATATSVPVEVAATATLPRPRLAATETMILVDTDEQAGLTFELVPGVNEDKRCIFVFVRGVNVTNWVIQIEGGPFAVFMPVGSAFVCGLQSEQEVKFTLFDANDQIVAGAQAISARGGDAWYAEWLANDSAAGNDTTEVQVTPTVTSAPVVNRALRISLKNSDDTPRCISMQISGIRTNGWTLKADGLKLSANFDGAGNARLCGLKRQQEFTFSVFDAKGGAVAGGGGIPARGGNIFVAEWR
jgi:hypothetical protein